MSVLGCIYNSHDLWLVLVAAVVCVAGSWSSLKLFDRATHTLGIERMAWFLLVAAIAGATIWCTHFIAMLGYDPGTPVGFDPVLTIVSLLVAILGAALGFGVAASGDKRYMPALGGGLVGLAVATMHYTGMLAYRVQGIVTWDMAYLVASIVLSVAGSSAALHLTRNLPARRRLHVAAGVFTLAIVSLHFTGMTAFRVEPMLLLGSFSNPAALKALALAVSGVALVVVGVGLASHLIDNRAREEAADALDNMSNGLLMVAGNGTIRLYNDRVLELFGLGRDDIWVGMALGDCLARVGGMIGWDATRIRRIVESHFAWMALDTTTRIEHQFDDGKTLSISCRPTADGGAILTYDDVTEAREGQRQIAHMAFHDALTGLSNRRSFADHTARMSRLGHYAMLMIDLDHFKPVNDMLGHAVGDRLLIDVARRVKEACGPAEIAFRLGGDELAVLTAKPDAEARALAEAIVAALTRPFEIGDQVVSIGASIGLATSEDDVSAEMVQKKADLALYRAKERGRGRVEVYRTGMIEEASARRRLEADLAAGVGKGEFELRYQPLYHLPDFRLSGFEALIRWSHPERGYVSPADFIPVAEQSGAIVEIGAWVIDEACRQLSAWPGDIYMSVNVSPVQLRTADILGQVTAALDRHGLTPNRLEIEITETAMVEDSKKIADVLAGLRALGVRIAMDDFGTGFSSLAHLREFKLDRIKIDRSFVSSSELDAGSAAVVRAITSMARDLKIETTGEGVETEAQLDNLIALGCGTAQGFLLGKPLSRGDATELVAAPRNAATAGRTTG